MKVSPPDFSNYFEEPLEAFETAKEFLDGFEGKGYIHPSAKVLEYVVIEPPYYIGKNAIVGPFAHIRPYTFIGDDCHIGKPEIKASIILDNTNIGHNSYVGDSIIGKNCNLGAGATTANLRFDKENVKISYHGKRIDSGRKKLGAIVGDDVNVGINASIMPGVKIGSGCEIGPAALVDRDLEKNVFYGYKRKSFLFFTYDKLVKEKIKGRKAT